MPISMHNGTNDIVTRSGNVSVDIRGYQTRVICSDQEDTRARRMGYEITNKLAWTSIWNTVKHAWIGMLEFMGKYLMGEITEQMPMMADRTVWRGWGQYNTEWEYWQS